MPIPFRFLPLILSVVCLAFAVDPVRAADAGTAPPTDTSELKQGACPEDQMESDRGCVTRPRIRKKVPPKYPEFLRLAKIQGKVTARATIDVDGKVTDVTIVAREPKFPDNWEYPTFEEATIDAVSQWEYAPATIDGRPIAVRYTVMVEFKLK